MALIVGGTTVTGTQVLDATKLSGTLPAISAENLTNVPSGTSVPTTTAGAVGSFTFMRRIVSNTSSNGTTSSFLRYSHGGVTDLSSSNVGGTWRNMQGATLNQDLAAVWQRQS